MLRGGGVDKEEEDKRNNDWCYFACIRFSYWFDWSNIVTYWFIRSVRDAYHFQIGKLLTYRNLIAAAHTGDILRTTMVNLLKIITTCIKLVAKVALRRSVNSFMECVKFSYEIWLSLFLLWLYNCEIEWFKKWLYCTEFPHM